VGFAREGRRRSAAGGSSRGFRGAGNPLGEEGGSRPSPLALGPCGLWFSLLLLGLASSWEVTEALGSPRSPLELWFSAVYGVFH